ncbi:DUF3850 domain-containing protein [Lewinella sp. W8]|uniref:DUF3850 domain-containing protein n=1 Tax=Lewinella sp. W8 TaxID=2528208 RepID=UPI00106878B7|nr:DUF3850 domain-containing protein [Lewinella sp. W8]MTB53057.1 DUF3850 domain-containing protein [Lewinella sp. W8]
MKVHYLKTVEPFFSQLKSRNKKFELRKNDRPYEVGDVLVCEGYDPELDAYFGGKVASRVTSILTDKEGSAFGLKEGYCIMSLERFEGQIDNTLYSS